jgi:hypothetical protein
MQVMMVMYETKDDFGRRTTDQDYWPAWQSYSAALREAGVLVSGNALQQPDTGAMVAIQDGRARIEDGPYAEGRDQLGGYYIIEVETLDVALTWAARAPCAATCRVEVRPVMTM